MSKENREIARMDLNIEHLIKERDSLLALLAEERDEFGRKEILILRERDLYKEASEKIGKIPTILEHEVGRASQQVMFCGAIEIAQSAFHPKAKRKENKHV